MPPLHQVHLAQRQSQLPNDAVARELVEVDDGQQQGASLCLQKGQFEGEALLEHGVLRLALDARLPRVLVVRQQAHLHVGVGVRHVLSRPVARDWRGEVASLDDPHTEVTVDEVILRAEVKHAQLVAQEDLVVRQRVHVIATT